MKKLLCVLLAILVLFSVCACDVKIPGAEQSAPDSSETASKESESTGFAYDIAIPVSISAAFTLYLDADMNIVSVDDCDEAAQNLFAQLNLAGMPYEEGIALVLETASMQGILGDGSEIVFDLNPDVADSGLIASLCIPCAQFSVAQKIELSVIPNFNVKKMSNRHTDGKKLQKERISARRQDLNGGWIDGSATIFTMGIKKDIVKAYMTYDNGDISIDYYEKGVITRHYFKSAEGQYNYCEYENGTPFGSFSKSADGSYFFEDYKNGAISSAYWNHTDGVFSITISDSNGMILSAYHQTSDGYISKVTYYQNGNLNTTETWSNGEHMVFTYGEDGTLLESIQEPWDGTTPNNG